VPTAPKRGVWAEDSACLYLQQQGVHILGRNLRFRRGEIDILAQDRQVLLFVEVRWRNQRGHAAASIDWRKRRKIRFCAQCILQKRFGDLQHWPACRFDVIAIDPAGLHWIRNAFSLSEDF
jgi:putative endonuclease